MKSRFNSNFFKAAAFGTGMAVMVKMVQVQQEAWRKMDEEDKAAGRPSSRPFSYQTGDQQRETLRYMEKEMGCKKAVGRYTGTGHPYPECVGGWEEPEVKKIENDSHHKEESMPRYGN